MSEGGLAAAEAATQPPIDARRRKRRRLSFVTGSLTIGSLGSSVGVGIGLMLVSMMLMATMDVVAKHLTTRYEVPQILFVRFIMFFGFAAVLAGRRGFLRTVRSRKPVLQVTRSLLLVVEMAIFIVSFSLLPLAEVHAVAALSPLIATALAVPLLGERIDRGRWVALGVGCAGVVVIAGPSGHTFGPAMLLPLVAAFMWALYQVMVRQVGAADPPETTIFYTAAVGLIVWSLIGPFFWVAPGSLLDWAMLAAVGVLGLLGHTILIMAYGRAAASTLQPFAYTLVLWATMFGVLFFGDIPAWTTILGATLVVGAGIYGFDRERRTRPNG